MLIKKIGKGFLAAAVTVLCLGALGGVLGNLFLADAGKPAAAKTPADEVLMDRYDMYMTNRISDALGGVMEVEKVYWLKDSDIVAPKPNRDHYGASNDPEVLRQLLEDAQAMLDWQPTVFTPETRLHWGTEAKWYLDETICSITWKTPINGVMYSFSEIKIAHPSQFRRFLADGTYGAERQYYTTEMSAAVNAVVASDGDFYKFRPYGSVVYNGTIYRMEPRLDMCFINEQGKMLMERSGTFQNEEMLQAYVEENQVRFSLAFGPILIEDGKNVVPWSYPVGEINGRYARAALVELGELHYLLAVTSLEAPYEMSPTARDFANVLVSLGAKQAYCLDGGQTAVIVFDNKLINIPVYGYPRTVSDIIYFATAVPDGGV